MRAAALFFCARRRYYEKTAFTLLALALALTMVSAAFAAENLEPEALPGIVPAMQEDTEERYDAKPKTSLALSTLISPA